MLEDSEKNRIQKEGFRHDERRCFERFPDQILTADSAFFGSVHHLQILLHDTGEGALYQYLDLLQPSFRHLADVYMDQSVDIRGQPMENAPI